MALITLPSKVYFEKIDKFTLLRSGVTLRSRYTGKRQTIVHPFALWVLEGKLIPMSGTDAGEWRAFLVSLQGQKNTFQLPVPGSPSPLSGYTGNATVGTFGANARDMTFTLAGLQAGPTSVLKKGDFFTVNGELKVATADVTKASAATTATVQFEPALRGSLAAGATVAIQNPYVVMAMQSDDSGGWALDRPVKHGIKISAIEDF